jgi:hypothetical protein
MSSFFNDEVVKQDSQLSKDPLTLEYLNDPHRVAHEALHHMIVECGWKQPDSEVTWRHVALMPCNDCQTVKPIIIDLSRCEKIEKEEERKIIFENHLEILRQRFPQKVKD